MAIARLILLTWLLLTSLPDQTPVFTMRLHAQQPASDPVDTLWIDVGLRPQLVEDFNSKARPDDVARVDHPSMVDILDDVTVGRKLVVFKSVVDAEALLPHISDQLDIIGYNLEHGPSNRPDEQADPLGSAIRMRELADQYGKQVAFGPDRSFAVNNGVEIAPYVDMFILQVQRVQTRPETVRNFVEPLVQQYRRVNPNLEVSIQIRTEGDVKQLHDLVASMTDTLDGVSILTSDETVAVGMDLIDEFRPTPGAAIPPTAVTTPEPSAARPSPAGTALQEAPAVAATATATRAPAPLPNPATPADRSWFFLVSLFTVGILGGGLFIASIVYVVQHLGTR